MSEAISAPNINLHDIDALQQIRVRENVVLRPMKNEDAPRLLAILKDDPSIRESVTVAARMQTEEDVSNEIATMMLDSGLIRYAITDGDDTCIGLISFWSDPGFFGQDPLPNTYGFGYFINPTMRRKGIVKDSLKVLMTTAKDHISAIEGFTAFCVDDNKDSVAVLSALGFKPTDRLYPEPTHGWEERQYIRGLDDE